MLYWLIEWFRRRDRRKCDPHAADKFRLCDLKCCGTCRFLEPVHNFDAWNETGVPLLRFPLSGRCALASGPAMKNPKVAVDEDGSPSSMKLVGFPIANRHFLHTCGDYRRKKGT